MKCPKCNEDMNSGEIAETCGGSGFIWTPEDFFNNSVGNLFTKKGALKRGQ